MQIQPIFASFIAEELLSIEIDNIVKYCRDLQRKDIGCTVSNRGGWQSTPITKVNVANKKLLNIISNRVKALHNHFSLENIFFDSYWVNINKRGDYNAPHDHAKSFYSAVFYAAAPMNSGNLIFMHPIPFFANYMQAKKYNYFTSNEWVVTPKTGLLIIFPSYLSHYVEPNTSPKDRISLAFNFNLK